MATISPEHCGLFSALTEVTTDTTDCN